MDKLRTEVGSLTDPLALLKLPYLQAVLCESMRMVRAKMVFVFVLRFFLLQRPVTAVGPFRELDRDVGILSAGTMVNVPIFALQNDPASFANPDKFQPERFLDGAGALQKPLPGAWLPFSAGPRQCIGQKLALLEMSTVVSAVVSRYNLLLHEPERVVPEMHFTWKPKSGVWVSLQKRNGVGVGA